MKSQSFPHSLFLILLGITSLSCGGERAPSTTKAEPESTPVPKAPDLESSIATIKEDFQSTEKDLNSFLKKVAVIEDEGVDYLNGYYDKEGDAKKVTKESAIGHASSFVSYYLNDDEPYFVFEENTAEESLRGPYHFEEKRIYLRDGEIIRALEKTKTVNGNEDPEMSKVPNKDVTAALNDKSGKVYLSEVERLVKVLAEKGKTDLVLENTRWKSNEDLKSILEFKNGKQITYYNGKNIGSGDYSLDKGGGMILLSVNDGGELFEYSVVDYSETELQMTMVGGRGNILKYIKE